MPENSPTLEAPTLPQFLNDPPRRTKRRLGTGDGTGNVNASALHSQRLLVEGVGSTGSTRAVLVAWLNGLPIENGTAVGHTFAEIDSACRVQGQKRQKRKKN